MNESRRKDREKRMRNRLRIGYTLLGLFVLLAIVAWAITGRFMLFPAFLVPVGLAYLFAGLWERKELKK